jgi:FKBP-type peptidyl-prolyl cis-trans isomerase FkpA
MKRTFYTLPGIGLSAILFFVACSTKTSPGTVSVSCTDTDPSADSAALLNFAKTNGIAPLTDTIGLYYQIVSQGTGAAPTLTSTISITYKGTLLDGTVFDSTGTTPRSFPLNELIPAWQLALPHVQSGGHIKLLVPSKYGYGCAGNSAIPPNTPIYFDITLVGVQ